MLTGPESGSPSGMEPGGPLSPESNIPREFREYSERSSSALPMPGTDLIEQLQSIEVGESGEVEQLRRVVQEALAFREGLVSGVGGEVYSFDPTERTDKQKIALDKQKVALLENMFTSVEASTARPYVAYLDIAIDEAIEGRIRRAQSYRNDPDKWRQGEARKYETLNRRLIKSGRGPIDQEEITGLISANERELVNEYLAIPKLAGLKNHVHARRVFDTAFIHRMQTCEDPGRASKLGIELTTVTPDGGHWIGLLQGEARGEFGQDVNSALEEMVKFALPDDTVRTLQLEPIPPEVRKYVPQNVYATGFDNATEFGVWLKHLLTKSNGRMDVVWGAWRLMLTMEVADTLGEDVNKDKNTWMLAAPPIGNALMTFLAHLEKKRTIELGLDKDKRRVQVDRYVSHGGLPMSFDMIPNLCEDFLHNSEVDFDKSYRDSYRQAAENMARNLPADGGGKNDKLRQTIREWLEGRKDKLKGVSLWNLWLYGRLSLADSKFPWFMTEQETKDNEPGELPLGSFGGWLLRRFRAGPEGVLKDIRSRPSARDLADPDFFASRLRNWGKVLGVVKNLNPEEKGYLKPEENPRAWWVMGLVRYHLGGTKTDSPITKNDPERDYRTLSRSEEVLKKKTAAETRGSGTTGDIFHNAYICGFLRQEDIAWIKEQLGIMETA